MNLAGKVAIVTGASAGIGAAICRSLVNLDMTVVGVARSHDKIEELAKEINGKGKGSLTAIKCDIAKDDEVTSMFQQVITSFSKVHVVINNAGISFGNTLLEGTPEEWRAMLDVNIVGVCLLTKLAVQSMRQNGIDDGHILNISSSTAHRIPFDHKAHFYSSSKHALRALTEGLRRELRSLKSHIRASVLLLASSSVASIHDFLQSVLQSISPAIVETDFSIKLKGADEAKKVYSSMMCLQAVDVAALVEQILTAPPHVEINDMLIRPTEQTY